MSQVIRPHQGKQFGRGPVKAGAGSEALWDHGHSELDALKVLVVDDEVQLCTLLEGVLARLGHRVATATSGQEALRLIRAETFEVVLLDLKMPDMDGLEMLKALKDSGIESEVVILTGHADVESAVTAMKLGAHDYLQKPFVVAELERVLRAAAESHRLKGQPAASRVGLDFRVPHAPILLGEDPKIVALRTIIERVAPTDATVLITGESGTGKELVARLIHIGSPRAGGPLVVFDCPAVPISLFESELFGHERGAFTSAVTRRQGKLEEADGGTLFLDEVGELPPEVQAKFLRFLQERRVTRVGGNMAMSVDARVISATNRDLTTMVQRGNFRRDFFHRLNVVQIDLPTLRERKRDTPLLVAHFVERFCRGAGIPTKEVSPDTLALLIAHTWPGNVRELENVIQRACILTPGGTITPDSLPPYILSEPAPADRTGTGDVRSLADADRRYVLEVLCQAQWNISRAARALGIHRATLYRKIMALGLRPDTAAEREAR
ncbi:MAG: sigma-54-dependent transcriptional regulator [Candidatus Methylomirabilia bacterium]